MEASTNVSSVEKEEEDVENRRDTVINDDHTRSHCQNDDKSEELLSPEKDGKEEQFEDANGKRLQTTPENESESQERKRQHDDDVECRAGNVYLTAAKFNSKVLDQYARSQSKISNSELNHDTTNQDTPPRTTKVVDGTAKLETLPIPLNIRRRYLREKELRHTEADPLKQVESYGSFTVMSSLIFGFAINFWALSATHSFEDQVIREVLFTVLMSLVLICNAFAMIVLSLTEFIIKRYLAEEGMEKFVRWYLAMFFQYRFMARRAFYLGVLFFMIATIVYVVPHLSIVSRAVGTLLVGAGTVLVAVTAYRMLYPDILSKKGLAMWSKIGVEMFEPNYIEDESSFSEIESPATT